MRTGFIAIPAAVGTAITTALPYASALVDTVSGVFGMKAQEEEYNKAVREQRKAQDEIEERRIKELAAARAQQTLELALAESERRRKEQMNVLLAVGGVALIVSGVFIYSATKRKK